MKDNDLFYGIFISSLPALISLANNMAVLGSDGINWNATLLGMVVWVIGVFWLFKSNKNNQVVSNQK